MTLRTALLVTYHFPPSAASGSHRLLGFARHLPKYGWRLPVVAPPVLPWEPRDDELAARIPQETTVYHVPHELSGIAALPLRMLAYYASWIPRAWPVCGRAVRRESPEVFITSGPPHTVHSFGLLLKKRFGMPWVADFRDPWVAGGKPRGSRSVQDRARAAIEARVMTAADAILVTAPGAADDLRAAYPAAAGKIISITNGFDPENFPRRAPATTEAIQIIHPGQIYAGRDPQPFFRALRRVADRQTGAGRIRVSFIGNLQESAALDNQVRRHGVGELVDITGHIPYRASLERMVSADILLLLDSPGRMSGVPGKLYEFIGSGTPILALCERGSDSARILHRSGARYRVAPPADDIAIERALTELLEVRAVESPDDQGMDSSPFTRESLAGELAAVLDRFVHSPSASPVAAEHTHREEYSQP